jgi:hypothetical protein
MRKQELKEGINHLKNWIVFCREGRLIYGFRIVPKRIPEAQKEFEIREILRKADELCGNKSGNEFLKSEMQYNGYSCNHKYKK